MRPLRSWRSWADLDCVITQNIDNLHQKAGNDPAKGLRTSRQHAVDPLPGLRERYPLEEILRKSGASEEIPSADAAGGS